MSAHLARGSATIYCRRADTIFPQSHSSALACERGHLAGFLVPSYAVYLKRKDGRGKALNILAVVDLVDGLSREVFKRMIDPLVRLLRCLRPLELDDDGMASVFLPRRQTHASVGHLRLVAELPLFA